MRAAALDASDVKFVFVGSTVLPRTRQGSQAGERAAAAAPWFAGVAEEVFRALGNVAWNPDHEETELLLSKADSGLARYVHPTNTLQWRGLLFTFGPDDVSVSCVPRPIALPAADNRGRDVLVFGVWKREGVESIAFVERLETTAQLSKRFPEAKKELEQVLRNSKSVSPLAYWRTQLTADLAVDKAVEKRASQVLLARSHGLAPGVSYLEESGAREQSVAFHASQCGSCHKTAVLQWSQSRHANAVSTLARIVKHRDPRCLPCHAAAFETGVTGSDAFPAQAAVTCSSCHKRGSLPREECANCHTNVTDPGQHFKAHIGHICAGSGDQLEGKKCPRE